MSVSRLNKKCFLQLFFFRFLVAYFLIFIIPFPANYLSFASIINRVYHKLSDKLISWTGRYIFHIPFPLTTNNSGSGDTTYNYVQIVVFIVLALVIVIIWEILDRKTRRYDFVLHWGMIFIRYFFAVTMIRYGVEKIIKAQFPYPFYSLNETYGESSPSRLMWNFMGYSTVYNLFIGAGEVIAGTLILFRKTGLLGTLLSIIILSNVVILNFCFDVAVKIFSLNLLSMALFIALPERKRLTDFFLINKSVQAVPIQRRFYTQRSNFVWFSFKWMLTLCILFSIVKTMRFKYYFYGDGAFTETPLFGIYKVETFVKNNDTLQPLITNTLQWRMLNIVYKRQATLKMMDDNLKVCTLVIDTTKRTMQLKDDSDSTYKAVLSYTKPDSIHLAVKGTIKQDSVSILLQKQDVNKYELLSRGFHWINETPYKK